MRLIVASNATTTFSISSDPDVSFLLSWPCRVIYVQLRAVVKNMHALASFCQFCASLVSG